jgi:hypothetical protein
MVCVKRGVVIEADKPIHSQLRLINFSEGSPYETLHAFISKTMAPYFKSYVKESGRADRSVSFFVGLVGGGGVVHVVVGG